MNLEKFEKRGIQHAKAFIIVRIMWYICKYGDVLASDIEERFDVSHTTLYRYLKEWEQRGYIKKDRVNGHANSRYVIRCAPKLKVLASKIASDIFSLLIDEFGDEDRNLGFSPGDFLFKKNDKSNKRDRNTDTSELKGFLRH